MLRLAVTTTKSESLASEMNTDGVLSLVIPSLELVPVSDESTKEAVFVAKGAVVSIVIVSCSDAATIKPAMICRAL